MSWFPVRLVSTASLTEMHILSRPFSTPPAPLNFRCSVSSVISSVCIFCSQSSFFAEKKMFEKVTVRFTTNSCYLISL